MDIKRVTMSAIFVLAALLLGCAGMSEQVRMKKYNETTKAYGEAIVWGHYEAASLFVKDDEGNMPDIENLENIKVASYDVKNVKRSEDTSRITQIVEIKYYKLNQLIVTSLRDEQLWVYDSNQKNWLLKTGLPAFK